jgi:serine protease Do
MRQTKRFLRENFLGLSLTLIGVLCLVLAAIFYMDRHSFSRFALAGGAGLDGPDIDLLEKQNKAYERIAEAVTPAVVNIQSTQVIRVQQSPFFNDPFFRQFFGDFFPRIPREQRERALGSGVIVSADGYIITNNHVISLGKNVSKEINVLLPDKREFKGKVVGHDPQTDVAVIKINASSLPTAPLGDSASLRVGDTVMAFGNPFNLSFTVTRGSVSGLGRSGLGIERGGYEDFIQTDSPINHGNSGGPLVNVRGQVVGINTAILSPSAGGGGEGAWSGIGFAIPSNLVKTVMQSLVKTGKVSRGYVGISLGELTANLARKFNVEPGSGVLVNEVEPDTPAERAGLQAGDIIQTFNGRKVESMNQFRFAVADTAPGTEVRLGILRDGQPKTIWLKVEEKPAELAQGGGPGGRGRGPSQGALRDMAVQNLTPSIRNQLGLPANTQGVVISDLDPDSPAAQAGLQPGDIIQSVNRQPVNNVTEFNRLAAQAKGEVLLRVNQQGISQFIVISPEEGG